VILRVLPVLSTAIYTQLSIAASSSILWGLNLFCNSAVEFGWLIELKEIRANSDGDRSIALVRGGQLGVCA
jgi:hypothetical protein